jgi:hypothetical protein
VPFDLDLITRAKIAPLALAKYSMRMVSASHQKITEAEEAAAAAALPTMLILVDRVLKFAFQCHQFAGGFDREANALFAQA